MDVAARSRSVLADGIVMASLQDQTQLNDANTWLIEQDLERGSCPAGRGGRAMPGPRDVNHSKCECACEQTMEIRFRIKNNLERYLKREEQYRFREHQPLSEAAGSSTDHKIKYEGK